MTEETEETRAVAAAAAVLVNLLGAIGLNAVQALAALDMAARLGRLELQPADIARAHSITTGILSRAGLVQ